MPESVAYFLSGAFVERSFLCADVAVYSPPPCERGQAVGAFDDDVRRLEHPCRLVSECLAEDGVWTRG